MNNTRRTQIIGKRRSSTKPTLVQTKKFAREKELSFHIAERALWEKNRNLLLTNEQAIKKAQAFWKKADKAEKRLEEIRKTGK